MKVAFATAELAPHVQVGGLADVARWLPAALRSEIDIRVFVPGYRGFDPLGHELESVGELDGGPFGALSLSRFDDAVFVIGSEHWYGRDSVYGFDDDHLRFGALCRGLVQACGEADWLPDVVHANDWHTALIPAFVEAAGWEHTATVLTIHNLAHQGEFPRADLAQMALDDVTGDDPVNSLRFGIESSEIVTTVSPRYATEVVHPERGMGLDAELRDLGDRFVGIINGIGPDWDPGSDEWIPHPFTTPEGKRPNTAALRERMGLAPAPGAPVLGVISRLDHQKGLDLLVDTIPPLLESGAIQLAVLGRGDPVLESMFSTFAERYPGRAAFQAAFDRGLGHLIEAGADIFLMPSRFEPGGLNQMYSMRYGTVPIVHRTGGLADTVTDWDGESGTGFVFDDFSPEGFTAALERALGVFADDSAWDRLMRTGMASDFSWDRSAARYLAVYDRAIEIRESR